MNLEATGKTISAEIKLWSSGGIIGSTRERHRQLISQEIEDLAKQFVTAWNLDNKAGLYDDLIPKQPDNSEWPGIPLNPRNGGYRDKAAPEGWEAGPAPTKIRRPPGYVAGPAPGPIDPSNTAQQNAAGHGPDAAIAAWQTDVASNPAASATLAQTNAPKPDAKTEPAVVTVKYRGPVNLAPFKCDRVTRSSFVERVCYDAANSYMLIDLTGTWYHYCEIDAGTVSNLMAADFMGRFYNQSIKGRFDCRTHRVPQY